MLLRDFIALGLFLVCKAGQAVALASSLPPFALKLIVVEETRALANSTDFRAELALVTAAHLKRSLTLALVTPVEVTLTAAEYLYAVLDDNLDGSVALAVANVGFQGAATYDGAELDVSLPTKAALSQDTGFWDLAKAISENDLLKDIAKLQVALGNQIIGEGDLVSDESDGPDGFGDSDDGNAPNTGLIVAATMCTIVSVVLLIGCAIFWKYNNEQQVERKKAEKRRMARQRRMMDNDKSSSYASRCDLSTDLSSDSTLKKSSSKPHKQMISKPSKEARKEKRLLRIIEQSEEGSDDKQDDQYVFEVGNESSLLSLQSCQSSLTQSMTCSPQKLAKGWNEDDVPVYMRNSRGFHTGVMPEQLHVSPTTLSPAKLRSPASWDTLSNGTGNCQGPFSKSDKFRKEAKSKNPIEGIRKPADHKVPAAGILKRPDSDTTPQEDPQQQQESRTPQNPRTIQRPIYRAGNESLAHLNFSGSVVSNQHSINSSTSSNCDHLPEVFLNDGPQKKAKKLPLSMAHDSVALLKSPTSIGNEEDECAGEAGLKFDMSCANFDMMDDSDLFEDCDQNFLDEINHIPKDEMKNSEHSIGLTSLQSGSNNSSTKRSTSKGSSASWRFT